MKRRFLKSVCLYRFPGIAAMFAFIWCLGCDSSNPTRFAPAEREPNLYVRVEVVLGDNGPSSKSDQYSQAISSVTNFKYKVEIEKKYTASDPLGAARAYAVVDGDTIFTSSNDWLSSSGSNHTFFIFAAASHSASPGNPASASVKIQAQWD